VKKRSIAFRLAAWYFLVFACGLAASGVAAWFAMRFRGQQSNAEGQLARLFEDGEVIAGFVRRAGEVGVV
jgi:hypothetical protein